MKGSTLARLVGLITLVVIIILVIIAFIVPDSPAQTFLLDLMFWLKSVPRSWGAVVMASIYGFGLIICLPGTPFNMASGFLFEVWIGSLTSVAGCISGATLSFFVGRFLARDWAQELIRSNKKAANVNLAVEKNGWIMIFMIRLSPILPFGICNYIFGVSKVSFSVYWTSTLVGLIPCTVAYTYLGSLMRNLADLFGSEESTQQQTIILVVSVAATVLGIIVITAVTKRTLDKTMDQSENEQLVLEKEELMPRKEYRNSVYGIASDLTCCLVDIPAAPSAVPQLIVTRYGSLENSPSVGRLS